MKTLMIIGQSHADQSSTQRFLYESIYQKENVYVHFLEKHAPFDAEKERLLLKTYDRIILQFPIYWYSCPALLKEWIDTVLSPKCQFLAGKELGVVAILGVQEQHYASGARERYTVSEMLRPFEMLANHFKMIYRPILPIFQFAYKSEVEKKALLVAYQQYILAPDFLSFQAKGQWLLDQLFMHKAQLTEQEQRIVDYIQLQADVLDDLKNVLATMKSGW